MSGSGVAHDPAPPPPAPPALPHGPLPDDAWSAWHRAFKMIELENQLVNHRMTSLLTLQGFLFTGLVFGAYGLADGQVTAYHRQIKGVRTGRCKQTAGIQHMRRWSSR